VESIGMYGFIIQKIYMKDQIKLPFILKAS